MNLTYYFILKVRPWSCKDYHTCFWLSMQVIPRNSAWFFAYLKFCMFCIIRSGTLYHCQHVSRQCHLLRNWLKVLMEYWDHRKNKHQKYTALPKKEKKVEMTIRKTDKSSSSCCLYLLQERKHDHMKSIHLLQPTEYILLFCYALVTWQIYLILWNLTREQNELSSAVAFNPLKQDINGVDIHSLAI